MWKVVNSRNQDTMRFDEAATAMAVFEIMKRDGYCVRLVTPCNVTVNS